MRKEELKHKTCYMHTGFVLRCLRRHAGRAAYHAHADGGPVSTGAAATAAAAAAAAAFLSACSMLTEARVGV